MSGMTPEYARRVFTPLSWQDRKERWTGDYGEPDFGGPHYLCGWPREQFNHTPANCAKKRKPGWLTPEERAEKEEDIKNDSINSVNSTN